MHRLIEQKTLPVIVLCLQRRQAEINNGENLPLHLNTPFTILMRLFKKLRQSMVQNSPAEMKLK